MKNITQYISDLLFQYECVIVPGLGGFVGNYKPASIHSIQSTFSPPSKHISFNKHLVANDGLLANYIAQIEEINYTSACRKINEFVLSIQQELNAKKSIILEDIGVLSLDSESRIQFEPKTRVNYLLASYGLTTFQKSLIKRDTLEDKITKEFKDRTAPLAVVKKEKNTTKKWIATAAIAIPFIFLAVWVPSKYNLGTDLNYANLNPFKTNSSALYVERLKLPLFKKEDNNNVKDQLASASSSTYFMKISFDDGASSVIVKMKDQPTAEAVSTYVSTTEVLQYHIIGGCFSKKGNAKKMVKKLKKKGFNAWVIGKRKGLWAVSYNSFSTRKEALDALASAQDDNAKAWILNQ